MRFRHSSFALIWLAALGAALGRPSIASAQYLPYSVAPSLVRPGAPSSPPTAATAAPVLGFGEPVSSAGAGAPGLAFQAGEPADQVFEVVRLRYADVSEVIGLLTADQAVKPNDNFTPQEPA
jgi:hypothetical protein